MLSSFCSRRPVLNFEDTAGFSGDGDKAGTTRADETLAISDIFTPDMREVGAVEDEPVMLPRAPVDEPRYLLPDPDPVSGPKAELEGVVENTDDGPP